MALVCKPNHGSRGCNGFLAFRICNPNRVRATKFEFEQRFWILCAIYAVGFLLSLVDHISLIVALRHLLAPSFAPGTPQANNFARMIITAGALLIFSSAALRTWAAAYLRTKVVHDTSQHSEALVADGPFRSTRNPLYLGNLPMAAGIGVLASRLGWLFLVVANWLFVYRLIFREEEALRQNQGEPYRRYLIAVPRFWPSLKPRLPAGDRVPQWGQAFAGESFVWLFGVAQLCVAPTLDWRFATVVFPLGFVAHFVAVRVIRRDRREAHEWRTEVRDP
jgi:protein-S-isoprenylcysteine O-methyltransferase Ste14